MRARLQSLLDEGVASGVFPRAWAVVLRGGDCVFEGGAGGATARTVFDLASLTKVMCTTAAFMSLWAEGEVEPETPVSRYLPGSATGSARITAGDLLYHRSGLPAFSPFFASVMCEHPRLFERDCPPEVRTAARTAVVEAALATPPAEPPGTRATYSDVGFIILGELLGVAADTPLDALFIRRAGVPLGIGARFRRLSVALAPGGPAIGTADIAATGTRRPRDPAPGQEGVWPPLDPHQSEPGEVDDDNAWAMDGVAGHAGLFGTADDAAAFGQAVLDELAGAGRIAPDPLWARAVTRDPETPGSTRALGFDTRLPGDDFTGSSAGRHIGQAPPGALGHLGFTGVSLWTDLGARLVVALCTNRTAAGRRETGLREFRPRFHDAVMEALGLAV